MLVYTFSVQVKGMTSAPFIEVCPSYVSIGATNCDVFACWHTVKSFISTAACAKIWSNLRAIASYRANLVKPSVVSNTCISLASKPRRQFASCYSRTQVLETYYYSHSEIQTDNLSCKPQVGVAKCQASTHSWWGVCLYLDHTTSLVAQ